MKLAAAARPLVRRVRSAAVLGAAFALLAPLPAKAEGGAPRPWAQAPAETRTCSLNIARTGARRLASGIAADLPAGRVRVTFLGHSSFLVETPAGASLVTDFNGRVAPPSIPDIVTMNRAHPSHFTDVPDVRIAHVLRGWDPAGGIVRHDLVWKDLRVFNIPTNVVGLGGGRAMNVNSIFVMQAAGLCLAHLGHLHHLLGRDQAKEMGRIDVLFVPIDGSTTLNHAEALDVIDTISPRLVIPMHFIFMDAVERFAQMASQRYKVFRHEGSAIEVSQTNLPAATEVLFLRPQAPF